MHPQNAVVCAPATRRKGQTLMPIRSTITWSAKEVLFHDRGYHKILWSYSCHGPAGLNETCDTVASDPPGTDMPAGVSLEAHLCAMRAVAVAQRGYRYWQLRSYRECP